MDDNDEITAKQRFTRCCKFHWRGMVVVLVPLVFLPILFMTPTLPMRCAYLVLVMATLWITEAIEISVTALIPIVAMPLFGIMASNETCVQYCKDVVLFFIVSMVVAMAVEYTQLHTRIALYVISIVGCSPRRLHFGMMVVTFLISFWISNSAATAMLCPIAKAILMQLDEQKLIKFHKDKVPLGIDEAPYPSNVTLAFFLGIAYAASIGGCATLIGTGTNLAIKGLYDERFPKGGELTFNTFIAFNVMPAIIIFLLTYVWLEFLLMGLFRPNSEIAKEVEVGKEGVKAALELIKQKRADLGAMRAKEYFVAVYFVLMVLLLFLRKPDIFPGYGDIINEKKIKNSPATILIGFLVFTTPASFAFLHYFRCKRPENDKPTDTLMDWDYFTSNFPWRVPLLLGGGFALSKGMNESGLAVYLGKSLHSISNLPHPVMQFCSVITGITFTAFSSNVAIANILLPVLFEIAVVANIHPLYIALPAGMMCSLAFHLPVSTPPNAIVAGLVNIRTKNMAIAGFGPSIISIIVYILFSQFWGPVVFPGFTSPPDWLKEESKMRSLY